MQKKYTQKIKASDYLAPDFDAKRSGFSKFYEAYQQSRKASKEIKLACECEKIIILLGLDKNGKIAVSALMEYLITYGIEESVHYEKLFDSLKHY